MCFVSYVVYILCGRPTKYRDSRIMVEVRLWMSTRRALASHILCQTLWLNHAMKIFSLMYRTCLQADYMSRWCYLRGTQCCPNSPGSVSRNVSYPSRHFYRLSSTRDKECLCWITFIMEEWAWAHLFFQSKTWWIESNNHGYHWNIVHWPSTLLH